MKEINHKFIIYGTGKLQQDFHYFFNDLEIDYCLDDDPALWNDADRIYGPNRLQTEDLDNCKIIICSAEPDRVAERLQGLGLERGKHFLYLEEAVFLLLGKGFDLQDKGYAIWGTGHLSESFYNSYKDIIAVTCFIDNNTEKTGKSFHGIEIRHPAEIPDLKSYFIIVANSFYAEVTRQLEALGLVEGKDFTHSQDPRFIVPPLLLKTMHAVKRSEKHCGRPFDTAYLSHRDGAYPAFLCCPYGLPVAIGDMREGSFEEIWKSDVAKVVRLSVINKTFSYCNLGWCGDQWTSPVPITYATQVPEGPKSLNIEFDQTCNLHCVFCRKTIELASEEEMRDMEVVAHKTNTEVIPKVEHVLLASNGEVFFSKIYRKVLEHKQEKKIDHVHILSNATLFTKDKWELLEGNYSNIYMAFSINAATPSTYNKIMKGARFETTVRNLEFAGSLRQDGKIQLLVLNFVVQKANFMEMKEFIHLAKRLHADTVAFSRLNDGGAYVGEAFREESMFDARFNMRPELKELMADSIFDDPIVQFLDGPALWGSRRKPMPLDSPHTELIQPTSGPTAGIRRGGQEA
jgi:MoaA/NifB/PqqE/SkfB family radical SAM enzyme